MITNIIIAFTITMLGWQTYMKRKVYAMNTGLRGNIFQIQNE